MEMNGYSTTMTKPEVQLYPAAVTQLGFHRSRLSIVPVIHTRHYDLGSSESEREVE